MTHDAEAIAALLIAHGSRRAEANADLVRMAVDVRTQGDYAIVEIAYLELSPPNIPEAAAACVARGARRIILLPFFLSAGRHVTEDLERFRLEIAAAHPGIRVDLAQPLSPHPLLSQIVADRLREARTGKSGRNR